jgi:regulator of RNase E activity RraA
MTKKIIGKPGFCIVPEIERPPQHLVEELGAIPVAVIGDGMGRRSIMDSGIKPLDRSFRMYGTAITVEVHAGDNLMVHAAVKLAQEGDVIVVNARGNIENGIYGDILNAVAQRKKLGGFVIDGAVRDCVEIVETGFPVFSRGVAPLGGGKEGPGQVNMQISCAGVVVNPGDVIVGDGDGVAVIPVDKLQAVLDGAKNKLAAEEKRVYAIQNGTMDEIYPSWLIPTLRAKGLLGQKETI